tara:strand:+ start:396 stop:584 length:189 start_codon:yes stop_codon:yes gene_type:complete
MKKDLTVKQVLLGWHSNQDIEEVFRQLIFTGDIPDDEETKRALEAVKKIPYFTNSWKNLKKT